MLAKTLLVVSVFTFFVLLAALIFNKQPPEDSSSLADEFVQEEEHEFSLNEYFQSQRESAFIFEDEYYVNDPFKQECAGTAGDGLPSIYSNIVCLR
jgi:hypothetical protein